MKSNDGWCNFTKKKKVCLSVIWLNKELGEVDEKGEHIKDILVTLFYERLIESEVGATNYGVRVENNDNEI